MIVLLFYHHSEAFTPSYISVSLRINRLLVCEKVDQARRLWIPYVVIFNHLLVLISLHSEFSQMSRCFFSLHQLNRLTSNHFVKLGEISFLFPRLIRRFDVWVMNK